MVVQLRQLQENIPQSQCVFDACHNIVVNLDLIITLDENNLAISLVTE